VNFNDPSCGFYQREVVDFINQKIYGNRVSSDFYVMHMNKSWYDVEKKLRDIITDPAISGTIKESCAFSTLALAVRFGKKQKQEEREKVKKLQDQLDEQKLFTNVLIGMVNRLRDVQNGEREKAQFELQQRLAVLHKVEEERDLLRNELLKVLNSQFQEKEGTKEEEKGKQTQTLGIPAYILSPTNRSRS
uniref:Testis-expressed protein 13 A-D N-terminal domain-containing protein n=1 Tax=Otolemur garnettii TaxID=30611 RepID=H0XVD6_OTOGA